MHHGPKTTVFCQYRHHRSKPFHRPFQCRSTHLRWLGCRKSNHLHCSAAAESMAFEPSSSGPRGSGAWLSGSAELWPHNRWGSMLGRPLPLQSFLNHSPRSACHRPGDEAHRSGPVLGEPLANSGRAGPRPFQRPVTLAGELLAHRASSSSSLLAGRLRRGPSAVAVSASCGAGVIGSLWGRVPLWVQRAWRQAGAGLPAFVFDAFRAALHIHHCRAPGRG